MAAPSESAPARTRTWTSAAAAAAVGLLSRVPIDTALPVAGAAGRAWARLGGPRTRVARTNLRIAFPEWSEAQRRRVCEEAFANLARGVVEFASLRRLDPAALAERVRLEGIQHLDAARRASPTGGVLVVTAHFGNWELMGNAMSAAGLPLSIVYRAREDASLDALVAHQREAGGAELLGRGSAARAALRAIREGRLLAVPYDQNCRRSEGVFVPFFGRLACTRDAPVRIAMHTGASVLPAFMHREKDGWRHRVQLHAPVELVKREQAERDPEAAIAENVRRVTAVIEREIRGSPSLWAWSHRRWRTQPAGEPRPYEGRRRR